MKGIGGGAARPAQGARDVRPDVRRLPQRDLRRRLRQAQRVQPRRAPREHRPLRCGPAEVHFFRTDDDVELRLTRFNGGPKGPVILAPGFGTSSRSPTRSTPPRRTSPSTSSSTGYDVWVLDYRASPSLASGSTQFTLDDIATYDYPAAVAKVREISGAESVQVMAHCIGSLTLLMSLALGLEGVRHGVASQVTLHPRAGVAQRDARRASTPATPCRRSASTPSPPTATTTRLGRPALRPGAAALPVGRGGVRAAVLPAA